MQLIKYMSSYTSAKFSCGDHKKTFIHFVK